MARKKRDYSDFIKFANRHKKLSENKLLAAYKEAGGKGKRQTLQQITRQVFGLEKGAGRGQSIGGKMNKEKAVRYITPTAATKKTRDFIKFNLKDYKQSQNISMLSPSVKKLKHTIDTLYHTNVDTYIKINMVIGDDGYTKHSAFGAMYPYDNKKKHGVKNTGYEIIQSLTTCYTNLAKMYKENRAYEMLKNTMLNKLKHLKTDLYKSKYMKKQDLLNLFARYDIEINSFELLTFKDGE